MNRSAPVVRAAQNVIAGAFLLCVLLGFVGWLSYVVTGSVPELLVAVGVYLAVTVELGTRFLGRLQRLRLL